MSRTIRGVVGVQVQESMLHLQPPKCFVSFHEVKFRLSPLRSETFEKALGRVTCTRDRAAARCVGSYLEGSLYSLSSRTLQQPRWYELCPTVLFVASTSRVGMERRWSEVRDEESAYTGARLT